MTVTHEVGTLVIYPKGTLHQRIIVMISACIFAKAKGIHVAMIWDHSVAYHSLFLGNITLLDISFFANKHYIYNPNVDQVELVQSIVPNPMSEMFMIVESDKEIISKEQNVAEYMLQRKKVYGELLKNHLSGMVLGQLNMYDYPVNKERLPVCFTTDTKLKDVTQKLIKLPMLKKDQFPDVKKEETVKYFSALIYSKADCLICENEETIPEEFLYATDISLVPIVSKKATCDRTNNMNGVAKNFLKYDTVINPCIHTLQFI